MLRTANLWGGNLKIYLSTDLCDIIILIRFCRYEVVTRIWLHLTPSRLNAQLISMSTPNTRTQTLALHLHAC